MKFNVAFAAVAATLVAAAPKITLSEPELTEFAKDSCKDRVQDPNYGNCLTAAKTCGPSLGGVVGVAGSKPRHEINPECLDLEMIRASGRSVTAADRLCARLSEDVDKCSGVMSDLLSDAANKNQDFLKCLDGTGPKKAQGPTKAHLTQSVCDNPKAKQSLELAKHDDCSVRFDWALYVVEKGCYGN